MIKIILKTLISIIFVWFIVSIVVVVLSFIFNGEYFIIRTIIILPFTFCACYVTRKTYRYIINILNNYEKIHNTK